MIKQGVNAGSVDRSVVLPDLGERRLDDDALENRSGGRDSGRHLAGVS